MKKYGILIFLCFCLLCLISCTKRQEQTQLALEESTVNRQSALDIPEKTAGKQLSKEAQPEPESPSLEEHIPVDETARAQWTDFADKWRLDYLPAFSR